MTHRHEWTTPQPCGDVCQGVQYVCDTCGASKLCDGEVIEDTTPAEVHEAMEAALRKSSETQEIKCAQCGKSVPLLEQFPNFLCFDCYAKEMNKIPTDELPPPDFKGSLLQDD